jgi:hypothetical protein
MPPAAHSPPASVGHHAVSCRGGPVPALGELPVAPLPPLPLRPVAPLPASSRLPAAMPSPDLPRSDESSPMRRAIGVSPGSGVSQDIASGFRVGVACGIGGGSVGMGVGSSGRGVGAGPLPSTVTEPL